MISAQILNTDATLNNFEELTSAEFIPGEQFRLVIRLLDTTKDLRYVPASSTILTLILQKTDGTELEKTATVLDAGDRSIQYVDISELESEDLLGGNIQLKLDIAGDGTNIRKGMIYNGLQKVITGDCCDG